MNEEAKQFIEKMGGAAKLSRLLNFPKGSGTQTVHNWKRRGIPSDVILKHPEVFREFINMPKRKRKQ